LTAERPLVTTKVYIDDVLAPTMNCMQMELSAGIVPSRAILMQSFGRDTVGPITLNDPSVGGGYVFGQRVRVDAITKGDEAHPLPIFLGWLMKRSDQGALDKVIWQAYDDRIFLQYVAMRGCVIYDAITKSLRYSARHPTIFNPEGFWNCIGVTYQSKTYPVFTQTAQMGLAYQSPEATYPKVPVVGEVSAWTPRRALLYLKLWATASLDGSIAGLSPGDQSFLSPTERLIIDYDTIYDLSAEDPAHLGVDPLDRKLQQLSVQGGSLLNAFGNVLNAVGTHSLAVEPDPYTTEPTKSNLIFRNTGYSTGVTDMDINIQRAGNVGDTLSEVPNCNDFNLDEDATLVVENCLVEGDAIRAESSLSFFGGHPTFPTDYADSTTSDIIPAWNYAQEKAFLECIHGGPSSSPGTSYAKIAAVNGDPGSLTVCDGSAYPKRILARSAEALQAARDSFPTVFRAWKLNGKSANIQTILGLANGGAGGLQGNRPIMPEQLQFMVKNLGGGSGVSNWLVTHFPLRVRFRDAVDVGWYEVPKDIGARVTPDGLIWLDGLAETACPGSDCVIVGDIMDQTDYINGIIMLRRMKINLAFPLDNRVQGASASTYFPVSSLMRYGFASNCAQFGRYLDAGRSFRRGIQYNSEPCLSPTYYSGANGTTPVDLSALTRDVPPGSEVPQAQYASLRILAKHAYPLREGWFKMIEVMPEILPGWRIGVINLLTPPDGVRAIPVNACFLSVKHDFMAQLTTLGGLLDTYGANR
jgi:hypothetical protein